jgi:hypothetical protein
MVVFGAGASYDSCPTHQVPAHHPETDEYRDCRFPLGDRLFEERELFFPILQRFPRALDVASYLRHLPLNTTVEQVMEKLRDEGRVLPRRHEQLAAIRYYLQVAIGECDSRWDHRAAHGVTNYKTLLDMIDLRRKPDESVCLVTFNYDTMLDAAMPTVGIQLRSVDEYIASNAYKVIKVHGSINWCREVEIAIDNIAQVNDEQLIRELIARAADLTLTDRFHLATNRPVSRLDPYRPAIPAIAIPVQTKGVFECPASHIATLKDCLSNVTKLLVIGWRANDKHFLDLMKKGRQNIDVFVVAGKPEYANEVIRNLEPGLDRPKRIQAGAGGFTQFILAEAETFLDES